jgi:hypothetical protein
MSGADSDADRPDELTERYRAASAADPARPSDSVRESVFAYARTVAADQAPRGIMRMRSRAANDSSWRLSAAASVIVAVFATLLAWHFHTPAALRGTEPNPAASDVAASSQSATGSSASSQPSEPLRIDRGASAAPAPDAVAARARERVNASADARSPRHDAAADRGTEGASVASARQALPRIAFGSAAENATSDSNASDAARGLENPSVTAQVAPSPAAAPPNAEARRSQALQAAASPRAGAAANSALISAAESGNLERVDQLLRSGTSTEQTDARGRTALLVATLRGDVTMVRRLLAAGARADVADEDGDTPLAAARRQGLPELVSVLEQATHP